MENMPWQVIAGLIALGIIALFIVIIVVVVKNKNLDAKAKINDTDVGLTITDGVEKSNKLDAKKIAVCLTKDDVVNLNLIKINMLKIHPVFTTIFNYILNSSDELNESQKTFILTYFSNSKKNSKGKLIKNVINKYMLISEALIKNYIILFKSILNQFINEAESDIKNEDTTFENSRKFYDAFIDDIVNQNQLYSTIDNIKCTGIKTKTGFIKPSIISSDTYLIFESFIKSESVNFYRDLMISKNEMFSANVNDYYGRYTSFINGIEIFLNSVLQYIFILNSEIKYKMIRKLCEGIDETLIVFSIANDSSEIESLELVSGNNIQNADNLFIKTGDIQNV